MLSQIRIGHALIAMMGLLGLAACTVTSVTPIDPYPELSRALQSEEAFRCEVACAVHGDFAASGLSPGQAKTAIDQHNAAAHHGGTNHTKVHCEPGPVEK